MIATRTIVLSTIVATCLQLSTGVASAGDDSADYESKVRDAKACIRRQARVYAAGTEKPEQAARQAFSVCEHLYKESTSAYSKATGLSPSESATLMPAVRSLATLELVEAISNIRKGLPVGQH